MSVALQSTYPTSPPATPEVTSAALQSTYPSGTHTGRGHAYKSGVSECFCELAPQRFLSRDPGVTSAFLQSTYPSWVQTGRESKASCMKLSRGISPPLVDRIRRLLRLR